MATSRALRWERRSLLEANHLDEDRVLRRHYATEVSRRRVGRYSELYDTWAPDLVIRDEVDFGATVLTEELDIPYAVVPVLALHPVTTTPAEIRDTVAAPLTDDGAQSAAQRMQLENTALPGPDSALTLLETEARHCSRPGDATDDGDRSRS
jgi:hypothetical protein